MGRYSWALIAAVVSACSSNGSSNDWVPSDIQRDQALSALGSAGYARLCSAFDDFVHDQYRSSSLVRAACMAHALETAEDAVACGEALDTCLDTLPPVVDQQLDAILAQASCGAISIDPSACPSTVSALKGCLDALGERVDQIELAATCAAFGSPVPETWWMIQAPPECTALAEDC